MSEARALTNFTGNAVATVVVGQWTDEFNADQAERVLAGEDPFDELTTVDDHHGDPHEIGMADRAPTLAVP
jgi:aerobic C4-dicarboxylate transport protein